MVRLYSRIQRLLPPLAFAFLISISLSSTIDMAGETVPKTELFKFTQKFFQDIGIDPPPSNQTHSRITSKNWIFLSPLVQFLISSAAYLLIEANSIIEYGIVFSNCLSAAICIILYLILIWRMNFFLSYIENCEQFIANSKYCLLVNL